MNNEAIKQVNETKFLGFILDKHLTWKTHINSISSKISKNIGIITKAKSFLLKSTLTTLYYSFIHPYYAYGIELYGNSCKVYSEHRKKV